MDIKPSDVISFGSLVLAGVLAYMQTKNKSVIWILVIVGLAALCASILSRSKPKGGSVKQSAGPSSVQQSASASGNATINQVGGNQTVNIITSEEQMQKLLKKTEEQRYDDELKSKYDMGCILLGVLGNGKITYDFDTAHDLVFDPKNDVQIMLSLDDSESKVLGFTLYLNYFHFTAKRGPEDGFTLHDMSFEMNYKEGTPNVLPWIRFNLIDGTSFKPYIEVLDPLNHIFVIGFKSDK